MKMCQKIYHAYDSMIHLSCIMKNLRKLLSPFCIAHNYQGFLNTSDTNSCNMRRLPWGRSISKLSDVFSELNVTNDILFQVYCARLLSQGEN